MDGDPFFYRPSKKGSIAFNQGGKIGAPQVNRRFLSSREA
jgi:hypothetical protein